MKIFFNKLSILLAILCVILTPPLDAQSISPVTVAEQENRLLEYFQLLHSTGESFRGWLREHIDDQIVPALSAGLVIDDQLVFEENHNAGPDTRFGIASLTKTFTAILIMQLAEEGYVQLDDTVNSYLPGIKIEREGLRSPPVTIRHLLSHSSGMPTTGEHTFAFLNRRIILLPEQQYPAGKRYIYANPGYHILKYLIERVTGASYANLVSEKIFKPLKMNSSCARNSSGSGGITTTLADLVKYSAMLISGGTFENCRILSAKSFRQMLTPVVAIPNNVYKEYYCALGWEVSLRNGHIDSFYKAGRYFGAASVLQVFPHKKAALIYICNPPRHYSRQFMDWRKRMTNRFRGFLLEVTR